MDLNNACARCGVDIRPYGVRAINKDGRTLELCGHHHDEHHDALKKQDWTITPIATVLEAQRSLESVEEPA
jgi:hypothetical protein